MNGYCTTDEELAQEQAMLTDDERRELTQLDAKAQAQQYIAEWITKGQAQRASATHAWDRLQRFVGNYSDRVMLVAGYEDEVTDALSIIRRVQGAIDLYCIVYGGDIPEDWAAFYND